MKLNKKNKLIFVVTGMILLSGLVHQNCGQIKEPSLGEASQSKSIFLQGLKAGESKALTITLKNGMQLKSELVVQQPYTIKLKDGTQLNLQVAKGIK